MESWTPSSAFSITAEQTSRLPHMGEMSSPLGSIEAQANSAEVLHAWFTRCRPWQWFRQSDAFDAEISRQFRPLTELALAGDLQAWEGDPAGGLALVLLLDQFSRQIWRGSSKAFAGHARAEKLSLQADRCGWIESEPKRAKRQFWLMPLLHSEDISTVAIAIPMLEMHVEQATADVARRNLKLLQQFGRYPHRNAALGRTSTAAEEAFLSR